MKIYYGHDNEFEDEFTLEEIYEWMQYTHRNIGYALWQGIEFDDSLCIEVFPDDAESNFVCFEFSDRCEQHHGMFAATNAHWMTGFYGSHILYIEAWADEIGSELLGFD